MPLPRLALVLVASLAMAAPCVAQNTFGDYTDHREAPEGVAGVDRARAAIDAYNSNDPDTILAFLRGAFSASFFESHSPEEHAGVWQRSYSGTGPLEYQAVRTYTEPRDDLVVIAYASVPETYQALVLMPDPETPDRFGGMYFAPARPPSYLEPSEPLSPEAAAARLGELIDKLASHDMFSGTVKITRGDEVLLEKAVGLASRRFDVPNTIDTKFNLGSMNKMFTAVCIAQLVEDGKLSFDDYVGDHLPNYPSSDVRERVQIKHLLSHTAGTGNHFTDEFVEGSKTVYRETGDYIGLFGDDDLRFEPGTDWGYSNAGFFILGMIVEAASGQDYYEYVREHIYEPAGMTDSDSYDMDIPVKNLAIGYTRSPMGGFPDDGMRWLETNGGWRNNNLMHSIKGTPAGGGFSTSPDLIRFAQALRSGTLVSPEMLETLTTPKPELSSPDYGYGFGTGESGGGLGRVVGHGGGFPGINANLEIYIDGDLNVAAMVNMDSAAGMITNRYQQLISTGN